MDENAHHLTPYLLIREVKKFKSSAFLPRSVQWFWLVLTEENRQVDLGWPWGCRSEREDSVAESTGRGLAAAPQSGSLPVAPSLQRRLRAGPVPSGVSPAGGLQSDLRAAASDLTPPPAPLLPRPLRGHYRSFSPAGHLSPAAPILTRLPPH